MNKRLSLTLKLFIPFVLIPLFALVGTILPSGKSHVFVSLFIAVLSIVLFYAGIEKKTVGTRRAVIVSVMVALSVAGRFIPVFKPVTAITVITAVYLGSESGFLVGSLSALISNFYFGQGPWTPFQMLAWGLIGFFAGVLAKPLQKSRGALLLYGAISGVIFSLVMDIWMVIWYNSEPNLSLYLSEIIFALPTTALYAVSNFIFLLFIAKPFGDKLERIKIKYGV